ncbi:MAG: permease-like cell division protein FtsX [Ruminiclostridium sp.]|nr:permease-like cell division protein FtsX [Ruminiclostridium sp.]
MRMSNFNYLVKRGVGSVFRNGMMSLASFFVLLVSLLLIGLSVLVAMDIGVIMSNIEEKNEIDVYVYGDVPQSTLNHITDALNANPNRLNVVFYSKEQAWEDKQNEMPEMKELFEYLPENPMPHTFRVTVKDISLISETADEFRTIEGVEKVTAPYDFASALVNIRSTLTVIAGAILVVMVATSIIIIYNAIRSSVFSRSKEINIMKVVGATNSFVKIPFFIEGMFIGVAAGAASWAITKVTYEALVQLFREDITIWRIFGLAEMVQFDTVTWYLLAANCILGALLGAIGTIISTGKYVRV